MSMDYRLGRGRDCPTVCADTVVMRADNTRDLTGRTGRSPCVADHKNDEGDVLQGTGRDCIVWEA